MANLVIPRLTRRPVREADIQKFHRPPLISAAFSPMDAESSGSKFPCVTVFNDAGCRVGARHDEMAVFRAKFSRDNARSVRPLMRPSRVPPRLRPTRSCYKICAVIIKWRETSRRAAFQNIVYFSLPYLLSYFLQTLYGMADLFITGQFRGVADITAVAIGSQVMHMLTVMIVGLAMGSTVAIGRAVGGGDRGARGLRDRQHSHAIHGALACAHRRALRARG